MNFTSSFHSPRPPRWALALGGFVILLLFWIYLHFTCSGIFWHLIGKRLLNLGFCLVILALIIWVVMDLMRLIKLPVPTPKLMPKPFEDSRFSPQHLTQTFIAFLPHLTPSLNLELATATQTEILEWNDVSRLWGWLNLGTNVARIQVAVTYRFHVCLYDAWQLTIQGSTLIVHSPPLRASLPPAIHTDQLRQETKRGWSRLPPNALRDQLHEDLTFILSQHTANPRRLALGRESCRLGAAMVGKQSHLA